MKKHFFLMVLMVVIPLIILAAAPTRQDITFRMKDFPLKMSVPGWRLSEMIQQYYMETEPVDDIRYVYFYDSLIPTKLDSIYLYYNPFEWRIWELYQKIVLTYEANQEYISVLDRYVYWDYSWHHFAHLTASYNAQHYITNMAGFWFDFEYMQWFPHARMHIIYNQDILVNVFFWNAGEKEEKQPYYNKISFDLDGQGRIIIETEQTSTDSLNWSNESRNLYTYHANDTTTMASFINAVSHSLPLMMIHDQGPPRGMITERINQNWDMSAWYDDSKEDYYYDVDDLLLSVYHRFWDGFEWNDNERNLYTYDLHQNPLTVESEWWNWWDEMWVPQDRNLYTWEQYTALDDPFVPVQSALKLSVYPNPFGSQTEIRIETKRSAPVQVKVFNIKGQLVSAYHLPKGSSNPVITLQDIKAPGIYFIKASQGKHEAVKKVVKFK